jgi:hypothetical protein
MLCRIDLRSVSSDSRAGVYRNLLERFPQSLRGCFPSESGYHHASEQEATWHISRGRFWGLWVTLMTSTSGDRLDVSITPYFPLVRRYSSHVERWDRDYVHLPGPLRFLAHHIVFAPSVLLVIAILPVMVVYRLALLPLIPSVRVAQRQLAAVWPGIQASSPGLTDLPRPRSPVKPFLLTAPVAAAITVACFRFAAADTAWRTILYVAGGIGVVVSLVLVIALALTLLGFEVTT